MLGCVEIVIRLCCHIVNFGNVFGNRNVRNPPQIVTKIGENIHMTEVENMLNETICDAPASKPCYIIFDKRQRLEAFDEDQVQYLIFLAQID